MTELNSLSPLPKADIQVGVALPFSIYDQEGHLLLAAGQAVGSERQLEEISKKGLFHNPRWMSHIPHVIKTKETTPPPSAAPTRLAKRQPTDDPSETGSAIKMSIDGSEEFFVIKLVGVLERDAFVVTHPMRDKSYVFVKEGQNWEFRSFYGLSVYRFSARIEKVLLSPYPLLVVSWPKDARVESKVIRAARRVSCLLPVSLRRLKEGVKEVFLNGMVENLSTGGLEFSSSSAVQFEKGEEVQVAFQLNLGDRRFLLEPKARVMSEARVDDTYTKHGLAFTELGDKDFASIHAYVSDKLIQKIESPLYSK